LEIVYSANNGIEGSNPSLSAMHHMFGLGDENLPARAGLGSATRRGGGRSEATEHIPLSPPDYLADGASGERSWSPRLRLAGQKICRADSSFNFSPMILNLIRVTEYEF
jgi:hypothetical protein